jgi:hypothetical protein
MSAFMVADKTINRVATFLERKLLRDWPYLAEKFRKAGLDIHNGKFCQTLGKEMFDLNIRGVNARYGDDEARKFRKLHFLFHPAYVDAIQVYKSLGCWLYQCMEGEVPNDPFYKLMQEAQYALANFIVSQLPEYDTAEWG